MGDDDFFSQYDGDTPVQTSSESAPRAERSEYQGERRSHDGNFAEEIYSKKIETRVRTYFIDLKQSMFGKFVKISERSKGQKKTIMIDAENLPEIIAALQEAQSNL